MTRSGWKRLAGIVGAGLCAAVVAAAGSAVWRPDSAVAEAPVPARFLLDFTAGGYNAGFALALQQGYYKRQRLDVTIEKGQGSGTTAQLVASGKYDIAYADALPVMQLIGKGAPMKVISTICQSNPNAVTALMGAGIKKIQDIKGHSVAVPTGRS